MYLNEKFIFSVLWIDIVNSYVPRDPTLISETFHYKRGANQQFCQMTHVFDPSHYSEDELLYDIDKEVIPVAIHCVAEEGPEGKYTNCSFARVFINVFSCD